MAVANQAVETNLGAEANQVEEGRILPHSLVEVSKVAVEVVQVQEENMDPHSLKAKKDPNMEEHLQTEDLNMVHPHQKNDRPINNYHFTTKFLDIIYFYIT